jgi:hypothetical protein
MSKLHGDAKQPGVPTFVRAHPDFWEETAVGVWHGWKRHKKTGAPSPRIPVELTGFRELHAPFLIERRTRGLVQRCVAGIRGPLRSLQRVGYATVGIEIRGNPPP